MTDDETYGELDGFEYDMDEEALFIHEEIKECFAMFDQKNRGSIPCKHLNKALETLGIVLPDVEVDEIVEKYDRDGFIEYPDFFVIAKEKIREIEPAVHLKKAFAVFDPDGEGIIPTERLKKWMTTLGDPLTESEAKELCKMGDPANKGMFLYDDVVNILIY